MIKLTCQELLPEVQLEPAIQYFVMDSVLDDENVETMENTRVKDIG